MLLHMKKGVDFVGVGVGAMIFNNEGKVFLAKRGQEARNERGKWEFPGGGLKFNERCEDGLKREIREEFDIKIKVVELLEVSDHIIKEEKQHWVAPSYIAKYISGTPKIMEPEKIVEFKWFNLTDIDLGIISLVSQSNFLKYKEKYGLTSLKKF